MPVGNITGLSSGIEWGDTVDLLMELERRPVDILESRREEYQSQLTIWGSIESKLTALKSQADELDSAQELLVKSATTTDSSVLTVSANANATPASHNIIINQLATNHTHAHQAGWADLNTTAVNNSGSDQSFSYEYDGTAITVNVPDGTTLQELANLINRDPDNPGIVATIIDDGSGGANPFHLMLSGEETGSGKNIQIIDTVDNPTDLYDGSHFNEANWDVTQTAQNAEIRVDGFPNPDWGWPNPWIESATNDIEDVIPGVTLHLKNDSDSESVGLEISLDTDAIKENINALVSAYNEVIDYIDTMTSYDEEKEIASPMLGDSLARGIKQTLLMAVAQSIPGTDDNDNYRSIGQVGVTLSTGGKLVVDEDELEDALNDDPMAVARLFIFDSESTSNYVSLTGRNENSIGGSYDFTLTYDADGKLDPSGTNTLNGVDVTIHGDYIAKGAEGTDVEGLFLLLTDPGDGPNSVSGSVKVYTGFSVLLSNEIDVMTDEYDGTLETNRDRINDSIDLLDQRIEAWEKRLEQIEENYLRKFTQMETLISQLRTQGSYISSI